MIKKRTSFRLSAVGIGTLLAAAGCDGRGALSDQVEQDDGVATLRSALTAEDGLADAFAQFEQDFVNFGFDQFFPIGYGFHPAMSTEKLGSPGHAPRGTATFDFAGGRITANLNDAPETGGFDLWLVKNVAGTGKSIKPESGDTLTKIGAFSGSGTTRILDIAVGATKVKTDFDVIVVTRSGKDPTASRIALGERTFMEKKHFYKKFGKTLPGVTGTVAKDVETTDQLIGRGAFVFNSETFGGNGRTCATCHRAERSLTIDAAFIATLPQSDPLFIAENNTTLKDLEDKVLMRTRGLIRENADGFEDPTHKFVARGVPHTLGLNQTNGFVNAADQFPFSPPDQRLGWGGDGAPGRSSIHEFVTGAIIQHFTKDLRRRPGTDFRLPTQEEADAIDAFQNFTGRQKVVTAFNEDLGLREAAAQRGQALFFGGEANCTFCHNDLSGNTFNASFNTNVAALTPDLPVDDGFLDPSVTFNFGTFNVPPLLEAPDTMPAFHNNAKATIEDAVSFYISPEFQAAPDFIPVDIDQQGINDIAAFLRVINAAENVRQVRKRVAFVKVNRTSGNTSLLAAAIADTQDAINDLEQRGLNPAAVNELKDVKTTLQTAKANPDANRPAFMDHALTFLDLAKNELITFNPKNQF